MKSKITLCVFFIFSSLLLTGCAGSPVRLSFMSPSQLQGQNTITLCNAYATTKSKKIRDEIYRRREIKESEWEAIDSGSIFIGMSELGLICSFGFPYDINQSVGIWGKHSQYVYHNSYESVMYVYVENGFVTSWQK
ncbi:MAG: hypothetical protein PHV55_07735 [Candidatus Omnitrophica bacterium]|nr:hypothetical protein [Candidatus Omnitrophota bacterium]